MGRTHRRQRRDVVHGQEQQFLALALKTYRGTNSDGRKKLRQLLKEFGG